MSDEDIELSADWDGEEGALVRELVAIRLMDGEEGERSLHDWAEHNPWAAGSDARSLKARWNAAKRHHGEAEADRLVPEYAAIRATSNASSNQPADAQQGDSNAPSPSPSPSPSPTPLAPPPGPEARATRLPSDWALPEPWQEWAKAERPDLDPIKTAEQFADFWRAKPGKDGRKLDWLATWRNWVRNQRAPLAAKTPQALAPPITTASDAAERTKREMEARMAHLNSPEAKAAAEAARIKFLESRKAPA